MTRHLRRLPWQVGSVVAGLVAGALTVWVVDSRFRGLEEQAQALVLRRAGVRPWNPDVAIIAIDDATRQQLRMVLPRALVARILEATHAAGARGIALDVLYDPPSIDGPEADESFRAALEKIQGVLAVECSAEELEDPSRLADLGRFAPEGPAPALPCVSTRLPYAAYRDATVLGHVQYQISESGLARGIPALASLPDGRRLPALALTAYLRAKGLTPKALLQLPEALSVGGMDIPLRDDGELLVSARQPPGRSLVSFAELARAVGLEGPAVLPPELASLFAGKLVFLGFTTRISGDFRPAIDGIDRPLVELHAALGMDLLEGSFLRELGSDMRRFVALLWAWLLVPVVLLLRPWRAAFGLAGVLGAWAGVLAKGASAAWLLPVAPVVLGALVTFAAALLVRLVAREREQSVLRSAFSSYVDETVLGRILEDPEKHLALGGTRREVTVLFADVVGYTALTNRLSPEQSLGILREYLAMATALVKARGGRIDKIMGDGLLAVFGDPLADPEHARNAVAVALQLQEMVVKLRANWPPGGGRELSVRLGIATGEAFTGNIGAPGSKIEYTVLGATVNLASRLESNAPPDGVLVSEDTRRSCGADFDFEPKPGLRLKGFEQPVDAWLARRRR